MLNSAARVMYALRREVGRVREFWRVVCAKTAHISVNQDLCLKPFTVAVSAHHPCELVAALRLAHVLHVYAARNIAQIFNSVVRRISIKVINVILGPHAMHVKKREPVSFVSMAVETDIQIAKWADVSCNSADLNAVAGADKPRKTAGLWVVEQCRTHAFSGKIKSAHAVVSLGQCVGSDCKGLASLAVAPL